MFIASPYTNNKGYTICHACLYLQYLDSMSDGLSCPGRKLYDIIPADMASLTLFKVNAIHLVCRFLCGTDELLETDLLSLNINIIF